jgi:hypothetical protein
MAIDSREKRASACGVTFIAGPSPTPNALKDLEWRQQVGYGYSGIEVGAIVIALTPGSFYNMYPNVRDNIVSDMFVNTRHNAGGDVWFDVVDEVTPQDTTFAILHGDLFDTAWSIINLLDQDIAWSVFQPILYFIEQFTAKAICLNFKTRSGETVEEQYNLISTFKMSEPVPFTFGIVEPVQFTHRLNMSGVGSFDPPFLTQQ